MSDYPGQEGMVGERLRRERTAAWLSQEELAELSGLSARTISDLERGRIRRPRRDTLRRLASALKLPAAERAGFGAAERWRAQLPADLADFTGRREQVEQLTALLTGAGDGGPPGAVVISAVAGSGGVGKSALAVHAGHKVTSQFPDGQLYLNLRGSSSQPMPTSDALARILRDLGTDPAAIPADEDERAARYRSLLAGLRLLVMLDDARDAAQVRPLLPGSGGCSVLVTSRRSLHDLESARVLHLGIMNDSDAVALFTGIVGPARAAAEPAAVREVLAACGGLPLAIRIAATRLAARPGWRIAVLADRLADARRRLEELQTGDLAVRASFLVSYAGMCRADAGGSATPPGRAFRVLSLADGPDLSLPAAAALLGVDAEQAERALELLVDCHLLQSPVPGRYRFHDLLRVYAAERAVAEDDPALRDQAVRRMLGWYVHTAAAAARLVHPNGNRIPLGPPAPGTTPLAFTGYTEALAWLECEYANLVSAVQQATKCGAHDLAWKLTASLWALFYLRGRVRDWVATHQLGLASARQLGDKHAELWILNNLGVAYLHAKRPEAAIGCFRQSLPIARSARDVRAVATTLVNLGYTLLEAGRQDEALQPLQESLCLFQKTGNRSGEGVALGGVARVYRHRGDARDAIASFHQSLQASRESGDVVTEGRTLLELSTVRLTLGQVEPAIRETMKAVEVYRQTGNQYGHAQAMVVLGRAERERGNTRRAHQHWLDAIAIFTELGLPQAGEITAELTALAHQSR